MQKFHTSLWFWFYLSSFLLALPALPDHIKTRLVVREGTKTYTIQCPAEGAPQPLIMWTKDGESITHAWNRFRQMNNDRDLRIKNVALEDAGLYKCQAVNGFGTVDLEYTVVVIGKKYFVDGAVFLFSQKKKLHFFSEHA